MNIIKNVPELIVPVLKAKGLEKLSDITGVSGIKQVETIIIIKNIIFFFIFFFINYKFNKKRLHTLLERLMIILINRVT